MISNSSLNTQDIATAFGAFWHKGEGSAHASISKIFLSAGVHDDYEFKPGVSGPNKQTRVLDAFRRSRRIGDPRKLVEGLLSDLRTQGQIGDSSEKDKGREGALRKALKRSGWSLSEEGFLETLGSIDLETGGRLALDEQLRRVQRNAEDPAIILGVAKELLESIAKFVLEENGMPVSKSIGYSGLLTLAFERLDIRPAQVNSDIEGAKQIKKIYQGAIQTATAINELRNLQGSGHGRTLPTGVTPETARYVIREASHVAELLLSTHDRRMNSSRIK